MTKPLAAGRELDALVAEKVMGWTETNWPVIGIDDDGAEYHRLPPFSESISDAWLVVEKMQKDRHVWVSGDPSGWECGIDWNDVEESADTAPLAICLAALKAVGHD